MRFGRWTGVWVGKWQEGLSWWGAGVEGGGCAKEGVRGCVCNFSQKPSVLPF